MNDFKQIGLIVIILFGLLGFLAYMNHEHTIPHELKQNISLNEENQTFDFIQNTTLLFSELSQRDVNETEKVDSWLRGACRGLNTSLENAETLEDFQEEYQKDHIEEPEDWKRKTLRINVYDEEEFIRGYCTVQDGKKEIHLN